METEVVAHTWQICLISSALEHESVSCHARPPVRVAYFSCVVCLQGLTKARLWWAEGLEVERTEQINQPLVRDPPTKKVVGVLAETAAFG